MMRKSFGYRLLGIASLVTVLMLFLFNHIANAAVCDQRVEKEFKAQFPDEKVERRIPVPAVDFKVRDFHTSSVEISYGAKTKGTPFNEMKDAPSSLSCEQKEPGPLIVVRRHNAQITAGTITGNLEDETYCEVDLDLTGDPISISPSSRTDTLSVNRVVFYFQKKNPKDACPDPKYEKKQSFLEDRHFRKEFSTVCCYDYDKTLALHHPDVPPQPAAPPAAPPAAGPDAPPPAAPGAQGAK